MSKTIILVSGTKEAQSALKFQQDQHFEKSVLVSTDVNAEIYFRRNHASHKMLHELKSWKDGFHQARKVPLRTTINLLKQAKVKQALTAERTDYSGVFTDILRHKIQTTLADFFTLSQICKYSHCKRLIIGKSFSQLTVEMISRDLNISVQQLTKTGLVNEDLSNFFLRMKRTLIPEIQKTLLIFYRHPLKASKATKLYKSFTKLHQLRKGGVLVFSNGLNLASYHSIFKHISKSMPVNIVTDRQSFMDSFYLAKYNLKAIEIGDIDKVNLSPHKGIHRQLKSQIENLIKEQKIKHDKAPTWIKQETFQQIVEDSLLLLSQDWLPGNLKKNLVAKYLINKYQPKLLITTHDPGPSAMAFVISAKQKGIRTIVFNHGSAPEEIFSFSDKELIWGPLMKSYMIQAGVKESRLITAGHPVYNDYKIYFQKQITSKSDHQKQVEIGIITSGYGANEPNQVEFFLKLFPQLAKIKRRITVTTRTHSWQFIDGLTELSRSHNIKLRHIQSELLEEFVARSDLIITQDSTASLVPLIAGKPTLYLPVYHPLQNKGSLANQPGFPKPITYNQVPETIDRLLSWPETINRERKKQQEFLKRYCGNIDNRIGSRAAKKIIRHLN